MNLLGEEYSMNYLELKGQSLIIEDHSTAADKAVFFLLKNDCRNNRANISKKGVTQLVSIFKILCPRFQHLIRGVE